MTESAARPSTEDRPEPPEIGRTEAIVRVGSATALIGAAVGWILLSYSNDRFRICHEEFAPQAVAVSTQTCAAITSDPILSGFLAALVLVPVVVLMGPFISKLGFAGASVELSALRIARRADAKSSLALVKSSSAAGFGLPPVDTGGPGVAAPAQAGSAVVSVEWTAARTEFLRAWDRIAERLEALAKNPRPYRGTVRDIYEASQRFSYDIEVLRATRELLDKAPLQLSEDDLKAQVERAKFVALRLDEVVNS
jgi:hypothetical protein